jgi:hypothetical protein
MSLIVVEGVDGSGKSTLLENARLEIKKKYFVIARHSCRPLSAADIIGFLRLAEMSAPFPVICDRHPLVSEPIYGNLLRGSDITDLVMISSVHKIDRLKRTVDRIVYCRPSYGQIRENVGKLPQLAGVIEKLPDLVEKYDEAMRTYERNGIRVVRYDYNWKTDLNELFFGAKPR